MANTRSGKGRGTAGSGKKTSVPAGSSRTSQKVVTPGSSGKPTGQPAGGVQDPPTEASYKAMYEALLAQKRLTLSTSTP